MGEAFLFSLACIKTAVLINVFNSGFHVLIPKVFMRIKVSPTCVTTGECEIYGGNGILDYTRIRCIYK